MMEILQRSEIKDRNAFIVLENLCKLLIKVSLSGICLFIFGINDNKKIEVIIINACAVNKVLNPYLEKIKVPTTAATAVPDASEKFT